MKKLQLESFIKRYSLGGNVSKVKWKYSAQDKTLHARAAIDNKSFIVDVIMNDFDAFGSDDLIFCVGDTDKILSMMKPFNEDINISINRSGDRIYGLSMADDDCESYCSAADPSIMDPVAKNLQDLPPPDVEILLTEDFIDKFKASYSALKDIDSFSVNINKKGLFEIVIGYATTNSNRIRLLPKVTSDKINLIKAISFPSKNISEILKNNSDIENGKMSVSNMGIVTFHFKNEKYSCTYYQFANIKQ